MKDKTARRCRIKFIMVVGLLLIGLVTMVDAANIAYVPKAAPGNTATAGAGKEWPTTRFVVNGDCITDNLTGLMWAKNGIIGFKSGGSLIAQPDYSNTTAANNQLIWSEAATAISNMNTATTKLCGYSDWRLPNINELRSLVNYAATQSASNPAAWLNTQGFTNVEAYFYWSSTAYNDSNAWIVYFNVGYSTYSVTGNDSQVWPVRAGQ